MPENGKVLCPWDRQDAFPEAGQGSEQPDGDEDAPEDAPAHCRGLAFKILSSPNYSVILHWCSAPRVEQ